MVSTDPSGLAIPDAHSLPSPIRKIASIVAIGVVVILVIVSLLGTRKPGVQIQDFGAYYRAGQAVRAGHSPYVLDVHGPLGAYMYAPLFAHFLFRLFAYLPYLWAVRAFMLINWIATIICVLLGLRLLGPHGRNAFLIGLLAVASAGTYLWADIHNGQVGTLLLLACLVWISLTLSGRSLLGGIVLALPIMLKIYPALLLPYLLLRRDWRGLAGVTVGLSVLVVAPVIFVGASRVLPLHVEWLRFCVQTQTADQTIRTGNQSLLGALARLPFVSDGNQTHFSADHLATLSRVYPAIVLVLSALVYGWIYLARRHRGTPSSTEQSLVEVSILLLWMTIASPRAWTFNFAAEILPALLLARAIVERRPRTWLAAAALVGVLVALTLNTNGIKFTPRWSPAGYFIQNKHFDALILLAVAVACMPLRAKNVESVGEAGSATSTDRAT